MACDSTTTSLQGFIGFFSLRENLKNLWQSILRFKFCKIMDCFATLIITKNKIQRRKQRV
ncbi:hypothetical protein CQA43_01510 [Helicobacter ganmani]|uniref:Uncharacterized protein n=1 Tax=Helicobacter ganmani TaxID=60246 RepID=A0A3D8IIL6_9HELI|nr:hypothetical protein CQA43_01510 [Helicobacter ganmani]